jgi:hypothetical protein
MSSNGVIATQAIIPSKYIYRIFGHADGAAPGGDRWVMFDAGFAGKHVWGFMQGNVKQRSTAVLTDPKDPKFRGQLSGMKTQTLYRFDGATFVCPNTCCGTLLPAGSLQCFCCRAFLLFDPAKPVGKFALAAPSAAAGKGCDSWVAPTPAARLSGKTKFESATKAEIEAKVENLIQVMGCKGQSGSTFAVLAPP